MMVQGCMTWKGVGYTAKIDCRMDGDLLAIKLSGTGWGRVG